MGGNEEKEHPKADSGKNRNLLYSLIYGVVIFLIIYAFGLIVSSMVEDDGEGNIAHTEEDLGADTPAKEALGDSVAAGADLKAKLEEAKLKLVEIRDYNRNSRIRNKNEVVDHKKELYSELYDEIKEGISSADNPDIRRRLEDIQAILNEPSTKAKVTQTSGAPHFNYTKEAGEEIDKIMSLIEDIYGKA